MMRTRICGPVGQTVATITALLTTISVASAQHHGGSGVHPPMPNQQPALHCRIDGTIIEVPVSLATPGAPSKLDQIVELPAPFKPIRIIHYYPRADIVRTVVASDGEGHNAIRLSIEGPTQSHQRWLVADDIEHNRLTSFIGSWRYMAVADAATRDNLQRQFETELTRAAKILVRAEDDETPWMDIPAEPNTTGKLANGYGLHVLRFYPHFALDEVTNRPVNQSSRRVNPAVLVSISHGQEKEDRWVFAEYPDFGTSRKERMPIQVRLDCPVDHKRVTPDFLLVTTGGTRHEVWMRHEERQTMRNVDLGKKIGVAGSQYTFSIADFIPNGRLVEEIRADAEHGSVSALQLEIDTGGAAPETLWLETDRERVLKTPQGALGVKFTLGGQASAGGHP